MNHDIVLKA